MAKENISGNLLYTLFKIISIYIKKIYKNAYFYHSKMQNTKKLFYRKKKNVQKHNKIKFRRRQV